MGTALKPFFGSSVSAVESECWIVDPRDPRQNTSDGSVVAVFSAQGYVLVAKTFGGLTLN